MTSKDRTESTVAMRLFAAKKARLSVIEGPDQGKSLILPSSSIIIGSADSCDFQLTDPLVSAEHLRLDHEGYWQVIEDLNSENGTFLNRDLVTRTAVFPGEIIQIGLTQLGLEYIRDEPDSGFVKQQGEWVQLPRIIAHELKNYLEFLDIGVEHLDRDPDIAQRHESQIRTLKCARGKMDELVHALRTGCIAPRFICIDVNQMVTEQLAILEPSIETCGITLKLLADSKPLHIMGDANQIGRALLNLLKNAIEACQRGDQICVRVQCEGNDIIITIEDDGSGMDRETCESMFVPLFTTKQEGNGLGAFIARTVIIRHGGTIDVESELNIGTRIRICLPSWEGDQDG
ncbi:FHA domain-containing protein [bacterium]|nr:FHA domain-containing protein [candidate division CSSED10-310 bacterium]